jgi:putative ABC transport system permease protein
VKDWFADVRYALRQINANPLFAVSAILTLSLGIGANIAIFGVIDVVVLRPLPYRDSDRLVSVWESVDKDPPTRMSSSSPGVGAVAPSRHLDPGRMTVSPANLVDYSTNIPAFACVAGFSALAMNVSATGSPERIWGERVTADYFSLLGVQPTKGRSFGREEEGRRVVVVSTALSLRKFGSPSTALSAVLRLDGEPYEIIGVMPVGFQAVTQFGMADPVEFWIPLDLSGAAPSDRGDHRINVVAQLRQGATVSQARTELNTLAYRLAQSYPETNKNIRVGIASLRDDIARAARPSLFLLQAAGGLLLLIACVNVANLMLVRAIRRQREITLRVALGASWIRIFRLLMIQSCVISLVGSVLGLGLAILTDKLFIALAPAGLPRLDSIGLDGRVLVFAGILGIATALTFGAIPLFRLPSRQLAESLRSTERSSSNASSLRWQRALVVAEVALSCLLLAGAGTLLKSFVLLNAVDLGFRSERVLVMEVHLPDKRYDTPQRQLAFFEQLTERTNTLPGVSSIAFANRLPLMGGWGGRVRIESSSGYRSVETELQAVSLDYFSTLGIPLLRGRLPSGADREGSAPVAVVNSKFAEEYFGSADPIGQRFQSHGAWITVVGVVTDIRRGGKAAKVAPQVYLPAAQPDLYSVPLSDLAVLAKEPFDPTTLVRSIQKELWSIDKDQPLSGIHRLDDVAAQSIAQSKFNTVLVISYSVLALILTLIGSYGVTAYSVSQRATEIGVRIALGATPVSVLRLIVGQALRSAVLGVTAGLVGSYMLSKYLASFLFGIQRLEPAVLVGVSVLIICTVTAAALAPASRAAHLDPSKALHSE